MAKKIIFIQKCNFNNIFVLCYIIVGIINNIIKYYKNPRNSISTEDQNEFKKYLLPYQILVLYIGNISDFLALIPFFIRKKLSKDNKQIDKLDSSKSNEDKNEDNESKQLIYNDAISEQANKRKKIIIIYIIILSILDFLICLFLFCIISFFLKNYYIFIILIVQSQSILFFNLFRVI